MTLQFKRRDSYGHARFYPANRPAEALLRLTGRACLKQQELDMLSDVGGFMIEVLQTGGGAP